MTDVAQVSITQVSATVTEAHAREHTIAVDRPLDVGGTDTGAKARELFLMSVGACFMKNLQAAIRARQADVSDVVINVIGTVDGTPKRYTTIDLQVSANYEYEAQFRKLLTIAERGCLLTNTIKAVVDLSVTIQQRQIG